MAGQVPSRKPDDFDIRPDETYTDWKIRKGQEKNLPPSVSQKNKKE